MKTNKNNGTSKHATKELVLAQAAELSHLAPSRPQLEAAPARAQRILRMYAGDLTTRALLYAAGLGAEQYEEGWSLLRAAYGETDNETPPEPAVFTLVARVDDECSTVFARVRSALHRFFPDQEAFVFAGDLGPGSGFESVVTLQTFLDRLDQLEAGPDRKDTHKEDAAAIALLTERGITKEMRDDLRKLCDLVEAAPTTVRAPKAPLPIGQRDPRQQALLALYAWVQDWTDTARAVITDKRTLRRLGIGKRRAKPKATPPAPQPPAPAPAPTPPVINPPAPTPPIANGAPVTA